MQKLILIMGVQRSGTTALFETLSTATGITAYNESPNSELYLDYDLRPEPEIRSLLCSAPNGVLLKPVNESKRRTIAQIFEEYSNYDITLIWLYRDPVNVIDSWRREGWTLADNFEGICMHWIVRNQRMLEQLPQFGDQVLVVRYEDLVADTAVVDALARKLNLRVTSILKPDSNAGRMNMERDLQVEIDFITADTCRLLDDARTFRCDVKNASPPWVKTAAGGTPGTPFGGWRRLLNPGRTSPAVETQVFTRPHFPAPAGTTGARQPNLFSLAFQRDPYAWFHEWRQRGDAHLLPNQKTWLLLRYDDVTAALADDDHFQTHTEVGFQTAVDASERAIARTMMLRLTSALAAERLQPQDTAVEEEVQATLRECCRLGDCDWIAVCSRLVGRLCAIWLGVSVEKADTLCHQVRSGAEVSDLRANLAENGPLWIATDEGDCTAAELRGLVTNAIDIASLVIVPSLCQVIWFLLTHPDMMRQAHRHPDQIPAVMGECLRLMAPILTIRRNCVASVEIAGQRLLEGSSVILGIGAANRDPAQFDAPDEFRLHRPPPAPICFVGYDSIWPQSPLPQRICEIVLRALLRETPSLRLTQGTESLIVLRHVNRGCFAYSPETMMVTLR